MSRRAYKEPGECLVDAVDAVAVERVQSAMIGPDRIARANAVFSALADPTRFRILFALSREELCVCDLSEVTGVSQSAVSHQLRVLRDRGLVAFVRDGQRAVYRLADGHVRDLIAIGLEHSDEARP